MPLYEYQCASCGHRLEIIQKFSEGPPDTCPKCGKGPLERRLSSPAIQFKGTGWYVTDYASKGKSGGGDSDSSSSAKSEKSESASGTSEGSSSGESKKSDTKGDAKGDSSSSTSTASPAPSKAPSKD